ncbi:hypothetical protein FA95DRAFT_1608682 [Auriscalpium vulgare]|uniref:Uncharacterized protein n=1 Tax=Auriscalpium vulgare TaxID=40419 RepID=A0ACB8RK56_9AGAM|nr:hypothetical protein FA95DRAFT_1608682 [Auriscalpium vulgare]
MSQTTALRAPSPFFRHRPLGRAPSPPTWACYEQIHALGGDNSASDDSDGDDDGDDDDDDDSSSDAAASCDDSACSEDGEDYAGAGHGNGAAAVDGMDMDEAGDAEKKAHAQKDKGKQRAVEPAVVLEAQQRRRRRNRQRRQPAVTLRPILTIQRSQGFVWNQDLFVPPYIKDRYVASTSPPNSTGFFSTSASSTNSALENYEIEVVEIRVREGELDDIIP